MKRTIVIAGVVALLLVGCGAKESSFDRYAQAMLDTKVTTENVGDASSIKAAVFAITCTTWASSTDAQREKAPASLAADATAAGYESTADDALAYLDAHCSR